MLGCTLLGAAITYLTFVRGNEDSIRKSTARQIESEVTLRHLVESHGELKADIKDVKNLSLLVNEHSVLLEDHEKRLTKLEKQDPHWQTQG